MTTSSWHGEMAHRCGCATSAARSTDRRTEYLGAWQNGKRGILLAVFKQPGANVIDTVEHVKAELPHLEASIPPSVHVGIIMDRTLTIRASVADVQFTLILSICLVVMVIFLFLRSFWATIIPAVTVPVALICTFAAMYLFGFSVDNLSLMALTIAVGFVVDDAIVMLENIFRYVEDGMEPMEAALKGAAEIGFTIVSISFSLVAVFIPLAADGRDRRTPVPRIRDDHHHAVLLSAFISLTLTPMMCARFLKHHTRRPQLGLPGDRGILRGPDRRLSPDAGYRAEVPLHHLDGVPGDGVAHDLPLYHHPEGLFSGAGHRRRRLASPRGRRTSRSSRWWRSSRSLSAIVAADPDTAGYGATVGAGVGGQTGNNGRIYIALKPWDERVGGSAQQYIARLRPKFAAVSGGRAFMQAAQDIRVGGRLTKTEFQYTLQDADFDELFSWGPKVLAKLQTLPMLRDVTSDQQTGGTTVTLSDRPRRGGAIRRAAAGDRQHDL